MNKKIIIFLILCAMVCIFPAAGVSAAGTDVIPNDNSGIPDRVLYQEVLEGLKLESVIEKSRQEFTKQEAEKLESLYLNNYKKKVKNFKGIGYLKNLKLLEISGGMKQIKGMEPLPKLRKLFISGNQLTEIQFVRNFKNLKSLNAQDNQIKSLKGMEKLRNLTYVNIGYNKVQSLKELRNCKKMDRLYAFYNELKDLKGLNKMKELKILSVDGNRLTSLAGVEKLNSLKTLSASRNRLADIKGVEGLSNLRKLFVGMNCLTGLEETAGLKGLRMIHAERNRLKNLPDLRSLRLTSFRFAYNFLDEQEFWTKLPQKLLNQTEEKIFSSGQVWLKDNIKLQNLDYSIELIEPSSVNQITKDTTRIVGRVNEKGASVMLTYDYNYQDHWICDLYAKADETGRFEFQNLDFKKQGGRLASLSFGMNAESTKNLNNGSCYYVECSQFRIKK